MIRLIVIALIFFAAIAVAPYLIGEKGYILIAMGDLTIESTVVTASIMLIVLFLIVLMTLKVFKGGLKFSVGTWHKIIFAGRRKAKREFNNGVSHFLLGDYKQAEHLFAKCAESSQRQEAAYLLAAYSANKQNLKSNADHYLNILAQFESENKVTSLDSVLVKIALYMSQNSHDKARLLIDEHHRHIGHDDRLRKLEIELSIVEKHFSIAAENLIPARKSKTFTEEEINHWEAIVFDGLFRQLIADKGNNALHDYWQSLPRKIKQRDSVLFKYCQVLAENNICEPLNKLLLPQLKKDVDEAFLSQIKVLPIAKPQELIVSVQKHLHKNTHSAKWLSCLAHLAAAGRDFAMAEKAFHSLIQLENIKLSNSDIACYAQVLIQQQKPQHASELLLNNWPRTS